MSPRQLLLGYSGYIRRASDAYHSGCNGLDDRAGVPLSFRTKIETQPVHRTNVVAIRWARPVGPAGRSDRAIERARTFFRYAYAARLEYEPE
jgi:hypothetical protein